MLSAKLLCILGFLTVSVSANLLSSVAKISSNAEYRLNPLASHALHRLKRQAVRFNETDFDVKDLPTECVMKCLYSMDERLDGIFPNTSSGSSKHKGQDLMEEYNPAKVEAFCNVYRRSSDCLKQCPDGEMRTFAISGLKIPETLCITKFEVSAAPIKKCQTDEFDCGSGICIDEKKVCDGKDDCTVSKADEKYCSTDQKCRNTANGSVCECLSGYAFDPKDPTKCIDIDECKTKHPHENPCSHYCVNKKGTYACHCYDGYALNPDKRTCKALGHERPTLWVTSGLQVHEFDIEAKSGRPKIDGLEAVNAMDFHYKRNLVVWSELKYLHIYICDLNQLNGRGIINASVCEKPLVSENVSDPTGLAIDWVHDLLYWTDARLNTISVINLDGKHRRTLLSTDFDEFMRIALDPLNGLMFWTVWGNHPKIEVAGMDGSNRKVLADTRHVLLPNGLTLDLLKHRVYWTDTSLELVMHCDYDGSNKRVVLSASPELHSPSGLAVFEERIYWTNWWDDGIYYANKINRSNPNLIARYVFLGAIIRVHHELAQPSQENKCKSLDCNHLCVPTMENGKRVHKCLCADGFAFHNGIEALVKNIAVVGLIVAISSFVCSVGWVVWTHHRKMELVDGMLFRIDESEHTMNGGVDSYDHLRISFDDNGHFTDVCQPTTTNALPSVKVHRF